MMEELTTESNKVGAGVINNPEIETVNEYVYFRQNIFIGKENQTKKINTRLKLSLVAFGKLGFIVKNKNIPLHLRTNVYNFCIFPIMSCGAQN